MEKHVFIIGSKGIPAKYGGYETFVENLTKGRTDDTIKYHVACKTLKKAEGKKEFIHNGAQCFNVYVPQIGPAQAIYYDVAAFNYAIKYCKENNLTSPIFYVLTCRIGPFMKHFKNIVRRLHGQIFVNPDGHEWLRAKWSKPVRRYWKYSEKLMVKYADLLICDSKNIEKYILSTYKRFKPNTTYIAYGADVVPSDILDGDEQIQSWFKEKKVRDHEYYLVVGRFVPENNYETIIKEFMKTKTSKDLVLITNVDNADFYDQLQSETNFLSDSRIKFVGTEYDAKVLKKVREEAFAYIHGHSVGGTNPSLLEALASTKLNLLFDVGFNREVGENTALYWTRDSNSLAGIIDKAERLNNKEITEYASQSTTQIKANFSWSKIINDYEALFVSKGLSKFS